MSEKQSILREGQKTLLERFAVHQELSGLQPAAAKVMALLMISDNTQLSFDTIRETLGISKSATSQAINNLLVLKKIEYVTHIGERKRLFQARIGNIKEDIEAISGTLAAAAVFYQDILKQRPDSSKDYNAKFKNMIEFQLFIAEELPRLAERFHARKT